MLQTSAQSDNRRLLKPLAGVTYQRLAQVADQAAASTRYLGETYASGPELVVGVEAILNDLVPRANDQAAVEKFEEAFRLLGKHIGFESQRPESEIGNGPDVLWALGGLNFAVIECKSGVENKFISRHDAAQLSHSMNWFGSAYDNSCKPIPVLIHKSENLKQKAVAHSWHSGDYIPQAQGATRCCARFCRGACLE